jgi:hypothetical protein
MKVLVNVERELLADAERWTPCVAVRLNEQADGSFDLWINTAGMDDDNMLARAMDAYDQAAGGSMDEADHASAMREAIAAALDIEP